MQAELKELSEKHRDEIEKQTSAFSESLEKSEQVRAELEQKMQQLTNAHEENTTELNRQHEEQREALLEEIEDLKEKLEEEREALKEQLQAKETELIKLRKEIDDLRETIQVKKIYTRNVIIAVLLTSTDSMQDMHKTQENRLTSLKNELTSQHAEQVRQLKENYEEEISKLRKQMPKDDSNDRASFEEQKAELEKKLEVCKDTN